ncbi:hypothetical protein [Microcystis aeruginosa]|uniref:hypothetical protein n=1 Tax=Microcystis aeruginosa TaxID=1126 RepID=UPI0007763AAF|nr:hypothetical protein [Microcystis aeruginosa]KXS91918.1 hypothetical protein OA58_08900 [Microcystis aeruginosa NIES-88]BCU10902.1 hypothetical protein MAN88_14660 [Microcystis aeruginosa]
MISLFLSVLVVTTPLNLPGNSHTPVYVSSTAKDEFDLGKFLEANWFIIATLIAVLSQLHMSVTEIKQEFKFIKNKLEEIQETNRNFASKKDLEDMIKKQRFILYTIDRLVDFINDKSKLSKEVFLIKHDPDDRQN